MSRMRIVFFLACCSCFSLFADSLGDSLGAASVPAAKQTEPCAAPAVKAPDPCPAPAPKEPAPCTKLKEITPPCYPGGFTLGITSMTTFFNDFYFLTFGYFDDLFLFDLGAAFEHINYKPPSVNFLILESHFGMRTRLYQNLFVNYGLVGSFAPVSTHQNSPNLYSIGCFTGLDFQALRHWLFSVKIHPFYFAKDSQHIKIYRVFMNGSFSVSYVF